MPDGRRCIGFGAFEFDPDAGELWRDGRPVRLRPQPGRVLAELLRRAGEVITHDDLRRAIWGESVHVDFEQALANALWEIRRALGDDPQSPEYVEVLPRRGYRFRLPVTACEPHTPPFRPAQEAASRSGSPLTSIAVLPFDNLTGDPAHDAFAAELTDELTTCLAKHRPLAVTSRTSAGRFGHTQRSLRDIGRQLHVSAIVEGSVACDSGHLRVNVQLVDTVTDCCLWAESVEGDADESLSRQRDIATRLAEALLAATGT